MKPSKLEKIIGYTFCDPEFLRRALTHSSFAYENPEEGPDDNELLEFLGDAVVGLAAAAYYYQAFPERGEGELSKLKSSAASTLALAQLARRIGLDRTLLLGRGEEKCGGRKKNSILAGSFEALAGAVFLDGGYEAARAMVQDLISGAARKPKDENFVINNFKSALQEHFQKSDLPAPVYRTLLEKGPDHEKTFVVEVGTPDRVLAKAKGNSRKSAEQKAAQIALRKILGRRMKILSDEAFIIEGEA